MTPRCVSAQFLVHFILLALSQYIELNRIVNPIIRRFTRQRFVNRLKIIISGRLTRKERASYIVKGAKSIPLTKVNVYIDYAFDFLIMRFGVVGIKVYLLSNKENPYHYFFEFKKKL
jgi:ribosomal protein S3